MKITTCLTAALLASALAMPTLATAAPPNRGGAAPHPAAHVGGGGPHFAPHIGGGGPHFAPHISSGAQHFTAHSIARPNFTHRFSGSHVTSHAATIHTARPNVTTSAVSNGSHDRHLGRQFNPATTHTHSNLAATPNAHVHGQHNNAAIKTQTARQGRFSSRFAARAAADPNSRSAHMAARRAWHHHDRAGFVGWYGPVFWPYAYSDIFDYAFWPYGYDEGYWDYAYDNFFDGLFWGDYGPADSAYAYAPSAGTRPMQVSRAGVQELCTEPGTGVTAWPFAEITRKVGLNDEQKQLLADVKTAAADAAATFKASCPATANFPLTPPGRLTAMTARVQATLEAVKIVKPALDKFYNSLSDEQKERFNRIGPQQPAPETTASTSQDSKSCTEAKPGLATLPIEKIKDVVHPTDAQQAGFKALQDATGKAVSILQTACPDNTPLTPPGRLAAMQTRLQAMVDAANTVKQPLDGFYASLSNEQKARFDRIGETLAQAD